MTQHASSSRPPASGDVPTAVILVDHGSRRGESNDMLLQVVELFRGQFGGRYVVVEPAHMELAEPSIATAFDRCVAAGARRVVVMPYFLLPGKHWYGDIPRLTEAAAQKHSHASAGIEFLVTAPLGLHPLMAQVVESRIEHCLRHAAGQAPECDVCAGTGRCAMKSARV